MLDKVCTCGSILAINQRHEALLIRHQATQIVSICPIRLAKSSVQHVQLELRREPTQSRIARFQHQVTPELITNDRSVQLGSSALQTALKF